MSQPLPMIYLARHGETAWTVSGQHTGLTDIPLTERGERNARRLGERLKGQTFRHVFTSPLQRTGVRASWPASVRWPLSIPILSNGTMALTKGARLRTFAESDRIGSCSGTAVQAAKVRRRSALVPIASWPDSGPWIATRCYSPAATSCVSSRLAGAGWRYRSAVTCF